MSGAMAHSIRNLRELFEELRSAADDAVVASISKDGGSASPAFQHADRRALMLAREIAAVQDAEQQ